MNKTRDIRLTGRALLDQNLLFGPVDLAVPVGWTCLLGASGVGKSTLLRLLAGLDTPATFDGTIENGGARPAYMAQNPALLPWARVADNVVIGARLRNENVEQDKARELLGKVGLTDHATKYPSELSGGQAQRVALARTLMEDANLVLLDEPFSALDARTRAEMQDLAVELLAGRSVLLVTHDPAEAARLADQAFIMHADGMTELQLPTIPAPRRFDAPETLKATGEMFVALSKDVA